MAAPGTIAVAQAQIVYSGVAGDARAVNVQPIASLQGNEGPLKAAPDIWVLAKATWAAGPELQLHGRRCAALSGQTCPGVLGVPS